MTHDRARENGSQTQHGRAIHVVYVAQSACSSRRSCVRGFERLRPRGRAVPGVASAGLKIVSVVGYVAAAPTDACADVIDP
ncbi:MAG: hypothetical protein CPDRYMAC_3699 [uncultured Paraburkholderia sp.]|nr:MAG: hypothetical protein CPDRYDRY_3535 [uncultured Paraburkholderia sp.]CAH2932398.1 MAG: hypothetical protein CPDRYMAC_3699 [uncultured Paraburkholderia sp.]